MKKKLLIYGRPLPLNREKHRDRRIRPRSESFEFAAEAQAVPLVCGEFSVAARDYPIVFAGGSAGRYLPAVLLGLFPKSNLFIKPSGQWVGGVHIPAFLRRYPFVVAESAASDEDFTVCIDEVAFDDGEGAMRLFEQNGEESPLLKHALSFLAGYQGQVRRTQAFVKTLMEYELLVEKKIDVRRPDGTTRGVNGFCVVDEKKLQALDGVALASLSASGALGLAYVHLMSLSNTKRLLVRLEARERERAKSPGMRCNSQG